MDTLNYLIGKYKINVNQQSPIEVPMMRRVDLASDFAALGFRVGVEVGVEQGFFSEVLCKANPDMKLYSVDAWSAYPGFHDYTENDKDALDEHHEEAKTRLAQYNCEIINKFSMDAVKDFKDESIDFVYIDANHEIPWCLEDIFWWSKKVRIGGIVAGHDYYKSTRGRKSKCHVWYAVNMYTQALCIKPWFLIGAKVEAVRAAPPEYSRDAERSWMWVKD
jgi:hypothetical protein